MSDEGLTVFNGRYELLRRIARGGMADVYLARDASLDRQVAVKVLFPEFANDPSFVERFRREAKAAANLNHPNIVGIYDWGQEQGTYYIVMEYVVGRSMADVMRSTGRLSPDRAAEIASDVAEALSSAHNAGLVHRDIKLGNIIVSDDGQVKVADFGIATALARRTGDNLTHIGSVMGTATYFSPEQAQGKALDGRSDLYSLGVVLYEMIVGKPPFTADTSTAVAVKHVQERPLAPSLLGVSIVESLEAIILKLLAKNPANRYPKAEDLRADLQRYLAGAHSIPTRTGQSPRVRTGERPATASPAPPVPAAPAAGRPRTGPVATAPPPSGGPPTGPRAQVPAAPGPGPGPPPQYVPPAYYYEEVHRSDGWKRTVLMFLGLVVLVAALGFLGWIFYDSLGLGDNNGPAEPTTPDNALIEVPDVSGLSYGEADALLRSAGLEPEPSYQVNTGVPENTVFAQSPPGGQRIEEGATVALTVSQGETPRVPPVRGRNRVDATEILRSAGYEVIVIEGTSQAEAGIVVGQEPSSNTELALGEAVTITVSTGPGQIFVPDVRGQTLIQAIQTLADQGFRVAERREPSATVPEGEIIETDPLHGFPVAVGLEIYIIVSDGPPLVAIPDVQGLLFDTGKLAIERAGLVVGIVTFEPVEPGSSDVGRILAQTPPPNLEVSAETEVDVVVGESAETEGDQVVPESPEGEGGETEGIDQTGAGLPEEPDETG
ncbi:MAG: Stk1 family PASTA domain-containing Ser/Thr kinase [Acidimicrobiaceae bacterium]|nr:Stk1 family PASTA domain-containing Ser/Thr kinase [Acidimicrobiaceae bacterium]MYI36100.1 Stk1 family PASTA domain-containing Ser/Thr kinase [Acidimicrobiaceae bacterium]